MKTHTIKNIPLLGHSFFTLDLNEFIEKNLLEKALNHITKMETSYYQKTGKLFIKYQNTAVIYAHLSEHNKLSKNDYLALAIENYDLAIKELKNSQLNFENLAYLGFCHYERGLVCLALEISTVEEDKLKEKLLAAQASFGPAIQAMEALLKPSAKFSHHDSFQIIYRSLAKAHYQMGWVYRLQFGILDEITDKTKLEWALKYFTQSLQYLHLIKSLDHSEVELLKNLTIKVNNICENNIHFSSNLNLFSIARAKLLDDKFPTNNEHYSPEKRNGF